MKSQEETFGKRLKRLREERGSQRKLSLTGISQTHISRLENEERDPSLSVIRALAQELGVSALYLETGQEAYCPHCLQERGNGKHAGI